MKTAWLIYNYEGAKLNKSYIEWFLAEAEKQNLKLELIMREDLKIGIINNKKAIYINNKPCTLPQAAIVRSIDPVLSSHLESMGTTVFNSAEVSRICNHKGLTHHAVSKLQIPMMDTLFYRSADLPETPPLPFPFVIKNVHGKGGTEVFFIEDKNDWNEVKDKLDQEIIVQSADVKLGKDLRVYVLGNEIVAAALRESNSGFKSNFTLGGSAALYELNAQEIELINKIISIFDFDLVGIDFLIGKNGELLFNEIEDVVGSRMLSELTDINLLEKYTSYILQKIG